ncbi:uncharacterized protein LOC100837344 [Brachypodium distachyon]|uniref:Transmembrane protein n=1 Tax=Brachypodium distachyon TaxID=15368 RepID=I1J283_BRADI|nr:uncharacterized protein LOC100837344 [Brachypodium distachyon]KQJ84802.1 hypothetical protein BRADI_5g22940v3 [Brachypodium distachyon]|eukprot:XP_003580621.1 uncharacterized protein LOC100837344 [Brachypodium distachyon]
MAAKSTSSSSCFSFLREALLLPTRNPKLFTPVLLFLFVASMVAPLTNVLCIQPLAADLGHLAAETKNTDPTSAEYARILEETQRDATKILAAAAALLLVALPLAFAKQILAFSAASTTHSGGRYSLAELLRALTTKGSGALNLKGPCITIAVVTVLEVSSMALLGALLYAMIGGRGSSKSGVIFVVLGLLFVLAVIAFLYLNVVAMVGVAASVVDGEGCRGLRALRRAWGLMTRVKWKKGFVLLLPAYLLPTLVAPLYAFGMMYAKTSMAIGLCLLSVYALLSSACELFAIAAATVYYYQAMEGREGTTACDHDAKIPTGETNV